MSHDSGFRRGGKDFTHRAPPKPRKGGGKAFEKRMKKRFHEHEREVQAAAAEETAEETDES